MTTPQLDAIQQTTLNVLQGILRPRQRVALVDFPNYDNAGDSLIYLGQVAYLKKLGVEIDYLIDQYRYDAQVLARLVPDGPILLQGGGNFGDRWERFQAFRERVISDFPDRQIIQLPQGIEFSDGPRLEKAQAVFAAHPNLTLLIRDSEGVRRTKELFPLANVLFCPDMAFGVGMIKPLQTPVLDMVVLQRDDSESVHDPITAPSSAMTVTVDWGLSGLETWHERVLRVPGMVVKRLPFLAVALHPVVKLAFGELARLRTKSAVKILSRGRLVVTDRLHATVFAALMSKRVVALPNANGKIKAIVSDYLGTLPGVEFVETAAEAERAIELHLANDRIAMPQGAAKNFL